MKIEKSMENEIRIIALDLDGTTLRKDSSLSPGNRDATEKACKRSYCVRVHREGLLRAVPENLLKIKGLRYVISSNGSHITDLATGQYIYSSFVDPEAVDRAIEIARKNDLTLEAFYHDKAYIDEDLFKDIRDKGCQYRNREYVMKTREPLSDILGFMKEHRDSIENINFFFPTVEERRKVAACYRINSKFNSALFSA